MEELNYKEVMEKIKARFPQGTVKKREDNGRAYIPNQAYTDRVEQATGSRWNLEIREVEINIPHGYVKVVARVTIGAYFRDGIGFAEIVDGKHVTNKVDQATNEAIREALDTWEMGWRDLAPHYQAEKDWGSNPALRHLLDAPPPESSAASSSQPNAKLERYCIKCGAHLTYAEWDILGHIHNLNRHKMTYCYDHLPEHMKRKLPEDVRTKFETS
ncbi:hypothetical protein FHS18_005486 [Paenibacillus phyllosphaerae]|uniref:Uncharacterized protein n=1 Tax=Paenibacillus phyllosphaerae TaxID=274593 RepID=A0A7W5B2R9_9BACL|nr:hypothetical protein [Paenibacillus phyllosphaerae]MBB3113374.1 hypothetical protein [Paenibacillus phyllosphaerae]